MDGGGGGSGGGGLPRPTGPIKIKIKLPGLKLPGAGPPAGGPSTLPPPAAASEAGGGPPPAKKARPDAGTAGGLPGPPGPPPGMGLGKMKLTIKMGSAPFGMKPAGSTPAASPRLPAPGPPPSRPSPGPGPLPVKPTLSRERKPAPKPTRRSSGASDGRAGPGAAGTPAEPRPRARPPPPPPPPLPPRVPPPPVASCVDSSVPEIPAVKAALLATVDKIAKRDKDGTFRAVVTDAVAPGYSAVVARPVSLQTIRAAVSGGQITDWAGLAAEFDLMFDNCRAFNGAESAYGARADAMQGHAGVALRQARATGGLPVRPPPLPPPVGGGIFGDRPPGVMAPWGSRVTASAGASYRPRRFAGQRVWRLEAAAAAEGMLCDDNHDPAALSKRDTYGHPVAPWRRPAGGLARGHNADGHTLAGALELLPACGGDPPPDAYARSVARFVAGLGGAARNAALARAAATLRAGV